MLSLETLKKLAYLGGIGTGCLKLFSDGRTEYDGLVKNSFSNRYNVSEIHNPLSFMLSVRPDDAKNASFCTLGGQSVEMRNMPVSKVKSFDNSFPFANVSYDTENYGVSCELCAFNPSIPHNSIDSGIPAAFFEFTLKNTSDTPKTVSLCVVAKSFFMSGKTEIGFDKQSACSYAALSESSKTVPVRRRGNICLATDAPDFTYEVHEGKENRAYFERFTRKNGFLTNRSVKEAVKDISAMLSFHVHLEAGESSKIRFVTAWIFPYFTDGGVRSAEKNYYCHYFPDVVSCASYCMTHFDRLKRESKKIQDVALKSGLGEREAKLVLSSFAAIKNPSMRRDSTGTLREIPEEALISGPDGISFALEYLFPGITLPSTVYALKNLIFAKGKSVESGEFAPCAYDTDCSAGEMASRFLMISRLYGAYKRIGELKFFSEYFVDICCMAEILSESLEDKQECFENVFTVYPAMLCAFKALTEVADVLRDKKRKIEFLELFVKFKDKLDKFAERYSQMCCYEILSSQFTAEYLCGLCLYSPEILNIAAKAAKNNRPMSMYACSTYRNGNFFGCAGLEKRHDRDGFLTMLEMLEKCEFDSERELLEFCSAACAFVPAASGYEYDKNTMEIAFTPDETNLDSGIFKSFISFDGGYGFVEQGEDYIELLVETGEIKVRKFICPHKPYKAMYAGRIWPCDIDANTVTLDSNLAVTKAKKLTILIDVTK